MNYGRVLITGGRGFIGVNLVKTLLPTFEVCVFDNLSRASPTGWVDGNADFFDGDILNSSNLEVALQGVSHVVHLAAFGSVIESIEDPVENFSVNAFGTLKVLQSAVKAGVKHFVFASTGGALIGDCTPPVDESSLPKPISPYGASKLAGEA